MGIHAKHGGIRCVTLMCLAAVTMSACVRGTTPRSNHCAFQNSERTAVSVAWVHNVLHVAWTRLPTGPGEDGVASVEFGDRRAPSYTLGMVTFSQGGGGVTLYDNSNTPHRVKPLIEGNLGPGVDRSSTSIPRAWVTALPRGFRWRATLGVHFRKSYAACPSHGKTLRA